KAAAVNGGGCVSAAAVQLQFRFSDLMFSLLLVF
ncbi:hypothetical protein A2U01_0112983, partial [Trifolium medium]|nr:hypothetical protein [Trifolium medium]